MIGETTGNEALAKFGSDYTARYENMLGEYGTTITDFREVDSFSKAFDYLGNNIALSLPYMAGTAAGAVLTAVTGGGAAAIALGTSIPASVYAGQAWNEQPEDNKNAGWALAGGVAQAVLDKAGIDHILGKGLPPKKIFEEATNALVKSGLSREAAKEVIAAGTKREIAGLSDDVYKIAQEQIGYKKLVKDMAKGAAKGAAGEGVTEAMQELIGYTAAHPGGEGFDWKEAYERSLTAAVAGSTIGGAFGSVGGVANQAKWLDAVAYNNPDLTASESAVQGYIDDEFNNTGRLRSTDEIAATANDTWNSNQGITIDERKLEHEQNQSRKNTLEVIGEKLKNPSALWRGSVRDALPKELLDVSKAARDISAIFGGTLQTINPGATFEERKHHLVSKYKNQVIRPEVFQTAFKTGRNKKMQVEASKTVYKALNAAVDKDGNFNPSAIPENTPNRALIVQLGNQLKTMGDSMHNDQSKHNPELGYVKNYLFKAKGFDKGAINKNQNSFKNLLKAEYNLSEADAKRITDEIIDNPTVYNADDAFSVVKGGIQPKSHKSRTLGLSENAKFDQFLEQDLFTNLSDAARSAARYSAHRQYIGENGAVVSQLLNQMQAEGVPEAEVNKVASKLQDYLDAESGNYKRPTSDFGKKLQRFQKNVMFFSTVSALPLAVFSSIVESALTQRALTQEQIIGKDGSIATYAKTAANGMAKTMLKKGPFDEKTDQFGRTPKEIIEDIGYKEWDVGAATVTGVTETNAWQKNAIEWFFRFNGLTAWTDYTRAIRASMAGDFMLDHAQTYSNWKNSGEPKTRQIQEAEEALRNLGLDLDTFIPLAQKHSANLPVSPEEEAAMQTMIDEATFRFVNDAVALPGAANRPLIYQDPRFALFTQFQGFIATFTANHIPKMYDEMVKRGSPAMKYNAFGIMATMIALGFLSQALKDEIKYGLAGEEDEGKGTGSNPYLDLPEYIQRGIRASGLLGTSERVLDLFAPIYEQRSRGPGDWAWNLVSGESPAISYGERVARAVGSGIEGDFNDAIYQGLKATPGAGPLTSTNRAAANVITNLVTKGEWDPKGGN